MADKINGGVKFKKLKTSLAFGVLAIVAGLYFLSQTSFAFDKNLSHPTLIDETVRYYNSFAKEKLTAQEIEWLKEGARAEDDSPRWVNHFYDSYNNRAVDLSLIQNKATRFLSVYASPLPPTTALDWAQNPKKQLIYGSDRTFQAALALYFENKREAFIALGSVLHLLQDMGVPDHSRADPHPLLEGSGYEQYAHDFIRGNTLTVADDLIAKKIIIRTPQNIQQSFDILSRYTADRWFSQHTINSKYFSEPVITQTGRRGEVFFYFNDQYNLILIKNDKGISLKDITINKDWFSAVTPEIVKNGAGVIDLYMREIEKRKKDDTLALMDRLQLRDMHAQVVVNKWNALLQIGYLPQRLFWGTIDAGASLMGMFENISMQARANVAETSNQQTVTAPAPDKVQQTEGIHENTQDQGSVADQTSYEEEIFNQQDTPSAPLDLAQGNQQLEENQLISQGQNQEKNSNFQTETEDAKQEEGENNTNNIVVSGGSGGGGGSTVSQTISANSCDQYRTISYPKVVISEVQFEGTQGVKDEYVELYNPGNDSVNLKCFVLQKYTSTSKNVSPLVPESKFEGTIAPHGFFLISHPTVKTTYSADLSYADSYSFSKNNALLLISPSGQTLDTIGFGDDSAKILDYEAHPFLENFSATSTFERKNLQDTDDNTDDFWLTAQNPENTNSIPRTPRSDFLDLRTLVIGSASSSFALATNILSLSFIEPTASSTSPNFAYQIAFASTTSGEFTYDFSDFGITTSSPSVNVNGASVFMSGEATQCPSTSDSYEVRVLLQDSLIPQNYTFATTTLSMQGYCSSGGTTISHDSDDATGAQEGTILISGAKLCSASSTKDEYIKLFNPNSFPVSVFNFSLTKISSTGSQQTIVPQSKFKGVMRAFSFFVLANDLADLGSVSADVRWAKSYSIADNNAVILKNANNVALDTLGWGSVTQFETAVFSQNPMCTEVIARKAGVNSTEDTMSGAELLYGAGFDLNDNSSDFFLATTTPQNSLIKEEPPKKPLSLALTLQSATITLDFISPYQWVGDATPVTAGSVSYVLKKSTSTLTDADIEAQWDSLTQLSVSVPSMRIGGYSEQFSFGACGNVVQNDWLILGVVGSSGLISFEKVQLTGNPNCTTTYQWTITGSWDINEFLNSGGGCSLYLSYNPFLPTIYFYYTDSLGIRRVLETYQWSCGSGADLGTVMRTTTSTLDLASGARMQVMSARSNTWNSLKDRTLFIKAYVGSMEVFSQSYVATQFGTDDVKIDATAYFSNPPQDITKITLTFEYSGNTVFNVVYERSQ